MSQPCHADNECPQYEICVKGHLGPHWGHWFEGFAMAEGRSWTIAPQANGETLLSGPVVDQAALYGVLIKVRDLGLPLISVMPVQPKSSNPESSN